MPFEPTRESERRALAEFTAVLEDAVPAHDFAQFGLFAARDEEFIRKEAERRLYDPELPHGGYREQKIVERLMRLSRDREWAGHRRAYVAATKWAAIAGWYYQCRPLAPSTDKSEYKWLCDTRDAAHEAGEWDRKWFAELTLKGSPERVADFRLECLFLLRRPDGHTDRLVRLINVVGEATGLEQLDAEAFHAPQKFRRWCLDRGNYNWGAGEKELQKLHIDIGRATAWKTVRQVVSCGWFPIETRSRRADNAQDGIWFFDDCAYADGKLLDADKFGIYWHGEVGYMLGDRGRESKFLQKRPKLKPGTQLDAIPLELTAPPPEIVGASRMTLFFREMCARLEDTVGGKEAWLLIGSMLSYAAAPEVYEKYSLFPGLWVHGQASSGKTTIIEWLMHLWGFDLHKGLDIIKNVTAVGMQIAAEQYCNLPVWFDEYRNLDVEDAKIAILRSAFNRGEQAKYSSDGNQREIKTAFIVSGESTTSDSATRSRYPHVQVAASRRRVNQMEWFNKHAQYFYLFGRMLIERRSEFSALVLRNLQTYREASDMAGVNERDKMVHGVSYSSWLALVEMLQSHSAAEAHEFRRFMLSHAREASVDVVSELNINVFWTDLIVAFKAGEIPLSCFRLQWTSLECPPGYLPDQTTQGRWASYRLFIDPEATLSALQIYLTKARQQITLKRKDLRDQLSRNEYWIEGQHRLRFGHCGATTAAWGFNIDKHPLGYNKVTDAEHNAFLMNTRASDMDHPGESVDRRLGDLYTIVKAVEKEELKREKDLA
jgi:hypothetical protein